MPSDEILPPMPSGPDRPKRKPSRKLVDSESDAFGVNKRGEGEDRYRIRYQRPEVAAHVARILVQNNMDWEAAIGGMLQAAAKANNWPDPTDTAIVRQAESLRKAPQIQTALRKHLRGIGIDDNAQKLYLSLLWGAALDRKNDARWNGAMKQLGTIMQLDKKADYDKMPVTLPLSGAGPMLRRMGIPVNDKIEIEEIEDEGTDERSFTEETEGDGVEEAESEQADGGEQ